MDDQTAWDHYQWTLLVKDLRSDKAMMWRIQYRCR